MPFVQKANRVHSSVPHVTSQEEDELFPLISFSLSCTMSSVDSNVVYVSNIRIERKKGPLRIAALPGEANPVIFSVHDEIARHYGVDEKNLPESHAATIDYVVAAAGG